MERVWTVRLVIVASVIIPVTIQALKGQSKSSRPNFIIFLADDTGYADLSSYGHPTQERGAIDQMAEDGITFTQWTSAASICSPSRAAILTGRYPVRSGMYGKLAPVITYNPIGGLPENETTLAEALTELGYATGYIGKWHLGCNRFNSSDGSNLPSFHGFQYVGTNFPFTSNGYCDPEKFTIGKMKDWCFLYNDTKIVQQPVDLSTITEKLVNDAKYFIRSQSKEDPFYLQLSFPQTHIALFCNKMFCGKSRRGIYGDNINEMAWAVGQILDLLKEREIDEDTLSLFLSDHGPEVSDCPWGGSSGVFRGGKRSTWEGGMRVPAIARWPGTLPRGVVSNSVVSSLDIFPTFLHLAGDPDYIRKKNLVIDGVLIDDMLNGSERNKTKRDILFYYCSDRIMAVRYKQYKIHYATKKTKHADYVRPNEIPTCSKFNPSFAGPFQCYGETIQVWNPPLVFDLSSHPEEKYALDPREESIAEMLLVVQELIVRHEETIVHVESEIDKPGGKQFSPCCNPPSCVCNYDL